MKRTLLFMVILALFGLSINAQNHKCGTMKHWEQIKQKDPNAEQRMQQLEIKTQEWIVKNEDHKDRSIITIPVVVHVLYHETIENISDAQIFSQIDVLNEDFRLLNADSLQPSHPFWYDAADCDIEFCLAQQDPDGNPTTGITRTYTDSTSFNEMYNEKFDVYGGKDNWEPTEYLNLWICNLGTGGTLGYAAFPSDLSATPEQDGVVFDFRAFGNIGTAGTGGFDANYLGRTGSHEVGHWLNLRHIWGDDPCGDDFCADTPEHEEENYGCPTFPHRPFNSCMPGTYENGEMYMNYMDYVDDNCMVMFTFDQADRMDAALYGARSGLLTSEGCTPSTGIYSLHNTSLDVSLYPNPTKDCFFIDVQSKMTEDVTISVINVLGEVVYQYSKPDVTTLSNFRIDLCSKSNGIYFVNVIMGKNVINKKIILSK
jgi:hypothetical protein